MVLAIADENAACGGHGDALQALELTITGAPAAEALQEKRKLASNVVNKACKKQYLEERTIRIEDLNAIIA